MSSESDAFGYMRPRRRRLHCQIDLLGQVVIFLAEREIVLVGVVLCGMQVIGCRLKVVASRFRTAAFCFVHQMSMKVVASRLDVRGCIFRFSSGLMRFAGISRGKFVP